MPATKRTTIYFDPALHDALRERAAEAETSISEIVNEVLRNALDEDEADHVIFEKRRDDPTVDFATALADLKRRGLL
jgi:Ribbon-helix-helix protein, copG family